MSIVQWIATGSNYNYLVESNKLVPSITCRGQLEI